MNTFSYLSFLCFLDFFFLLSFLRSGLSDLLEIKSIYTLKNEIFKVTLTALVSSSFSSQPSSSPLHCLPPTLMLLIAHLMAKVFWPMHIFSAQPYQLEFPFVWHHSLPTPRVPSDHHQSLFPQRNIPIFQRPHEVLHFSAVELVQFHESPLNCVIKKRMITIKLMDASQKKTFFHF